MPGKVTITVIAKYHTTTELEAECHEMVDYWFDAGHICLVVPSDATEEEVREEYIGREGGRCK